MITTYVRTSNISFTVPLLGKSIKFLDIWLESIELAAVPFLSLCKYTVMYVASRFIHIQNILQLDRYVANIHMYAYKRPNKFSHYTLVHMYVCMYVNLCM